jgi:hypothetical protein
MPAESHPIRNQAEGPVWLLRGPYAIFSLCRPCGPDGGGWAFSPVACATGRGCTGPSALRSSSCRVQSKSWGVNVLGADGRSDRTRMAQRVFGRPTPATQPENQAVTRH